MLTTSYFSVPSKDGNQLGSVGAYPDFLLTVWDWEAERIVLHTKAFSQEVFNVSFSPDDAGVLLTSGTGHIRFWKMAGTFTGLKLQGDIGKFGKVELSDVEAYAPLPDGKVLSSTERGSLLLWDGNFIKCEITQPDGKLCHDGEINCIVLEREEGFFITGGNDGYLRWWDFATVDRADTTDEMPVFQMKPLAEKFLGEGIKIKGMEKGVDHWLIQDSAGSMIKMSLADKEVQTVMEFHAKTITALASSPLDHFAATSGADGTVRCWDYVDKKELFRTKYPCGASCMIWAPPNIDNSAKTIVVGFENGVIRVLLRTPTAWKMLHVLKPHTARVNDIAYSPDGRYLASAGADNCLFLLKVGDEGGGYEPVGFYDLGAEINSVYWRSDSEAILISCGDGVVAEAEVPDGSHDTQETFELKLPLKKFVFKRPPPRQSAAEIEAEIQEALKPVDLLEEGQDAEDAEDAEDAGPAVVQEATASAAICAIYKDGSDDQSFFICFAGSDASSIFECTWDSEEAVAVIADSVLPTTTLNYTASRRFLVTGSRDGIVRIRSVENQNPFAQVIAHDGCSGAINAVATSFDDQFLLSVGDDGQFFVFRIKPDEIESQAALFEQKVKKRSEAVQAAGLLAEAKAKNEVKKVIESNSKEGAKQEPLPDPDKLKLLAVAQAEENDDDDDDDDSGFVFALEDAAEGDNSAAPGMPTGFEPAYSSVATDNHDMSLISQIEEPEDIVRDDVYSIQEAKVKTEEDNKLEAAEKKKGVVRGVIESLRTEYKKLVEQNAAEISERQLDSDAFMIEHDYFQKLIEEGEQECTEVRKELEYTSEKSELRLAKLKERFLDAVAVECVELGALKSQYSVRSFRCAHLSRELQESLRQVHAMIDAETLSRKAEADRDNANGSSALKPSAAGPSGQAASSAEGPGAGAAGGTGGGAQGFEARKLLRQARQAKLKGLEAERPAEDAEDPRDVRAIAFAEAHMGDYKLKTAANYVVPEEQRVNADKKRRQMVLLEESMHSVQMNFNGRFLSLRDLKKQIIQQIKDDNSRIHAINSELGQSESLWEPVTSDAEWPELRDIVTEENLRAHKSSLGVSAPEQEQPSEEANTQDADAPPPIGLDDSETKLQAAIDAGVPEYMVRIVKSPCTGELSELQLAEQEASHRRLKHERSSLMQKTSQTVGMFDEAIYELRQEKMQLDCDLKAAEMKMLTLYRELVLLRQFESKDDALASKMEKCRSDKSGVVGEISECQAKLGTKRDEIGVWQEKAKHIMNEFSALVGESNQFHHQLLKIFKKKVKRAKKRNGDEDEEEEEEEDWEEDDEDFDDEGEEEDEDEEDACPPGCDQTLYDKVLELREKRLDQEEILSDFQKAIDELTRNSDRHQTREKQINKDLAQTEKEIQGFQTEKQQRLNQLDVVITLKLDQLLCTVPRDVEAGGDPEVLSAGVNDCLVFGKKQLTQLKSRIQELEVENRTLRQQFKDLHKEQSRLAREKKLKESEIMASREKCDDLQMLKFGQIIDLEALDKVSVSKVCTHLMHSCHCLLLLTMYLICAGCG
jgi:WD40 repeat protein